LQLYKGSDGFLNPLYFVDLIDYVGFFFSFSSFFSWNFVTSELCSLLCFQGFSDWLYDLVFKIGLVPFWYFEATLFILLFLFLFFLTLFISLHEDFTGSAFGIL